MKKVLFFSLLFIFFQSFAIAKLKPLTGQQPAPGDSVEVFLSIQHHDEVIYNDVKNTLKSMNGVRYFTYCDNHSVFLIYINSAVHTTKELFLEQVSKLHPALSQRFLIMTGEFKDLVSYCEPQDVTDASNLKNSFVK